MLDVSQLDGSPSLAVGRRVEGDVVKVWQGRCSWSRDRWQRPVVLPHWRQLDGSGPSVLGNVGVVVDGDDFIIVAVVLNRTTVSGAVQLSGRREQLIGGARVKIRSHVGPAHDRVRSGGRHGWGSIDL